MDNNELINTIESYKKQLAQYEDIVNKAKNKKIEYRTSLNYLKDSRKKLIDNIIADGFDPEKLDEAIEKSLSSIEGLSKIIKESVTTGSIFQSELGKEDAF